MRAVRRALIVLLCVIGFVAKSDAQEKFRVVARFFDG